MRTKSINNVINRKKGMYEVLCRPTYIPATIITYVMTCVKASTAVNRSISEVEIRTLIREYRAKTCLQFVH